MERAAWTEERMDDLAHSVRSGFDRMDQDFRDLRSQMQHLESGLRGEINELRRVIFGFGTAVTVALIASILTRSV